MSISEALLRPRKALLAQLTAYYMLLAVAVWVLDSIAPEFAANLYSWEARGLGASPETLAGQAIDTRAVALRAESATALFVSIVGAVLLMLPIAWLYLGTRRRVFLDQSMIEALLILPIAVSGVVVIVQDSLPLAFSLAGIFAGIQFRSKLRFYADAHFFFIAIGVGLAAGIGALHIAAVMSACFNYIAYVVWRAGFGGEAGQRHLRYASEEARAEAQRRKDAIHLHQEGGATTPTPSAPTTPTPADD
jgi:hypothetical protein